MPKKLPSWALAGMQATHRLKRPGGGGQGRGGLKLINVAEGKGRGSI